jgi:hypothetical protein
MLSKLSSQPVKDHLTARTTRLCNTPLLPDQRRTTLRSWPGLFFEFSEVFNEDYLYFYGPHLEWISDAEAETVPDPYRSPDVSIRPEVYPLPGRHRVAAERQPIGYPSGAGRTGWLADGFNLDECVVEVAAAEV